MAAGPNSGSSLPEDGDVSICAGCDLVAKFTVGPLGVSLRRTTAEENEEIRADPVTQRILRASRTVKKRTAGS